MTEKSVKQPVSEAMVERVAKAMYRSSIKHAVEHIAMRDVPTKKITDVWNEAVQASDREASIVMFCLVDDLATSFFREKLTGKIKDGIDKTFFAGNGLLATAHNKLSLLAGLAWIRTPTYHQLTLMRKIRNEFAHHVHYKRFDHAPVCNYIAAMYSDVEVMLNPLEDARRPKELLVRTKFLMRSAAAIFDLVRDFAWIQAALLHRVDPTSISQSYDDQPDNMKTLAWATARFVLSAALNQDDPKGLLEALNHKDTIEKSPRISK